MVLKSQHADGKFRKLEPGEESDNPGKETQFKTGGLPAWYDPGGPCVARDRTKTQIVQLIRSGSTTYAACRELGIGATTVQHWMTKDPEFRQRVYDARVAAREVSDWMALEMAEARLYDLIEEGNVAAVIFAAKNLDPKRWTRERTIPQRVQHDVQVTHQVQDLVQLAQSLNSESCKMLVGPVIDVDPVAVKVDSD